MKKSILIATLLLFLTGCGVGTYSIQTGVEDAAYISFTTDSVLDIVVKVDDSKYDVSTVKQKAYKRDRDIKQTANNTIKLTPGTHQISVQFNDSEIYNRKVFLSAGETKIIEL
jgi:hypothetical protein